MFKKSLIAISLYMCAMLTPYLHQVGLKTYGNTTVYQMRGKTSGGTGFNVEGPSGKHYIISNAHVCNGILDIKAEFSEGETKIYNVVTLIRNGQFEYRKVLKIDQKHDLCLLEGYEDDNAINLAYFAFENEPAFAIGHPHLLELNVYSGYYNKLIDDQNYVEVDPEDKCEIDGQKTFNPFMGYLCLYPVKTWEARLPVYPGNSGSPVVNIFGQLIGVVYKKMGSSHDLSFIIPLDYVKDFLKGM